MRYLTTATDLLLRMCMGCDAKRNVWIAVMDDGAIVVGCRSCNRVIERIVPAAPVRT